MREFRTSVVLHSSTTFLDDLEGLVASNMFVWRITYTPLSQDSHLLRSGRMLQRDLQ